MTDVQDVKRALRQAIDGCRPDGSYDDATFDSIHALVERLLPLNPTPRPIDRQDLLSAPWGTLFAQFGPRHTAGKPIRHATSLRLQSFNAFPDLPIRLDGVEQEIRHSGFHYNNVCEVTTPDGRHRALLIVRGDYRMEPDHPQRCEVAFRAVELAAPDGVDDASLRGQFGLDADAPLRHGLSPPRLHSDILFCDEELRINAGSMGGLYVLNRLSTPGKSVSFA